VNANVQFGKPRNFTLLQVSEMFVGGRKAFIIWILGLLWSADAHNELYNSCVLEIMQRFESMRSYNALFQHQVDFGKRLFSFYSMKYWKLKFVSNLVSIWRARLLWYINSLAAVKIRQQHLLCEPWYKYHIVVELLHRRTSLILVGLVLPACSSLLKTMTGLSLSSS